MSPRLHKNQPFYGHTCFSTIDLYRKPHNYTGVITKNIINIQLKTSSNLSAEE
jgi:hypothetical protein